MLTLLHGLTMKTDECPDKFQILRLVRMLTKKTVIVLDNAVQLTLNQTELREDFIKLLKQIGAESDCIHFVVVVMSSDPGHKHTLGGHVDFAGDTDFAGNV